MNFAGLKKLKGQRVNLWPRPYWVQGQRHAQMQWLMYRVERKQRVAELLAPSGHIKDLADVINHYEHAGNTLVLDAQLIIDGNAVLVEPRPFGATSRSWRRRSQRRPRSVALPIVPPREPVSTLKDLLAFVGCLAIIKSIADSGVSGSGRNIGLGG
jgi:hypothetical protein